MKNTWTSLACVWVVLALYLRGAPAAKGEEDVPASPSLFDIPRVDSSTLFSEAAKNTRPAEESVAETSVSEATVEEEQEMVFMDLDPSVANQTLMGLPRKQMQYLTCGAANFGNEVPKDFSEFVLRAGNAAKRFNTANADLDSKKFDWRVGVKEHYRRANRTIRWSSFSRGLGSKVESTERPEVYRADDNRHQMPRFQLAVKEDSLSNIFDLFLFAPDEPGRVRAGEVFGMGASSEDLDSRAGQAQRLQKVQKERAADLIAEAIAKREEELRSGPESQFQSFVGLSDDGTPFMSLMPQNVEEVLREAEVEAIKQVIVQVEENREQAEEDKLKKARLAQTTFDGVTGAIMTGVSNSGSNVVSDPKRLQNDITTLMNAATGGRQATSNTAARVAESISKMASGQASVADIERLVSGGLDAAGLPNIRRLEKYVQRKLSKQKLQTLVAEVVVKDFSGDVVFGPIAMHCPYMAIPMKEMPSAEEGLIFEVTFVSSQGEIIVDDLERPVMLKSILMNEEDMRDVVDDPAQCPQLVLGVRALDIDFDEFKSNRTSRWFVRSVLAESLGVLPEDLTFCSVKKGSTIIGVDAGTDLTLEWDRIVSDPNSAIHKLMQLDPSFPSLVDKNDLYGENFPEVVDPTPPVVESIKEQQPPVVEELKPEDFEIATLPTGVPDRQIPERMEPLPKQLPGTVEQEEAGAGLAAWAWALIGVMIVVVVVVVVAVLTLVMLSRKKMKKDEDVVGRPVAGMVEEGRKGGRTLTKQPSTQIIDHDALKAPAINRDTRRPFDEQR